MEMINQGGDTYWVPAKDHNLGTISSYSRWGQAFRVHSDIFTQKFPEKASELIQYGHVISTASLTYQWENVYMYDRDFRMHISRHPEHSWGVNLHQSWAMRLKDRLTNNVGGNPYQNGNGKPNNSTKKTKICFPFNAGNCTYGYECKFEHRCLECGKFGHGSHNCRRLYGRKGRDG